MFLFLCFKVYVVFCFLVLVVHTSAINCLERLISKMTYSVSSGTLNPTQTSGIYSKNFATEPFLADIQIRKTLVETTRVVRK